MGWRVKLYMHLSNLPVEWKRAPPRDGFDGGDYAARLQTQREQRLSPLEAWQLSARLDADKFALLRRNNDNGVGSLAGLAFTALGTRSTRCPGRAWDSRSCRRNHGFFTSAQSHCGQQRN